MRVRKGDVMTEAEIGLMSLQNAGRGHEPRDVGSLVKLEKARKQVLSWRLWKEPALPTP